MRSRGRGEGGRFDFVLANPPFNVNAAENFVSKHAPIVLVRREGTFLNR